MIKAEVSFARTTEKRVTGYTQANMSRINVHELIVATKLANQSQTADNILAAYAKSKKAQLTLSQTELLINACNFTKTQNTLRNLFLEL